MNARIIQSQIMVVVAANDICETKDNLIEITNRIARSVIPRRDLSKASHTDREF
jgi:hypothetical protein